MQRGRDRCTAEKRRDKDSAWVSSHSVLRSRRSSTQRDTTKLKMPEIIFPKDWWKMTPSDYESAKITFKSLLQSRELDAGIKQVSGSYKLSNQVVT